MQWNDQAIVLSSIKYGETSSIVSLFTKEHGYHKSMARGGRSPKNCGIYQTGNIINVNWKARLATQLGYLTAELVYPAAPICMLDNFKLTGLISLCSIINKTLAEHEPHSQLFNNTLKLIAHIATTDYWLMEYIILEIDLLREIGFRLELDACAVTQTRNIEELIYVSPKSGKAVSADAGKIYHDKLLKLPKFLLNENLDASDEDLTAGLKLTDYFLNKYFFAPHNINKPEARIRLQELVS